MDIRLFGEWEPWVKFCLHVKDRKKIHSLQLAGSTLLVFELFCREPILTNAILVKRLKISKPTVQRALDALVKIGLVDEVSGKKRGKRYAYKKYLDILTRDTKTNIG